MNYVIKFARSDGMFRQQYSDVSRAWAVYRQLSNDRNVLTAAIGTTDGTLLEAFDRTKSEDPKEVHSHARKSEDTRRVSADMVGLTNPGTMRLRR